MKETRVIMSGDHPRKTLDGVKTMTRRTYGLEKINEEIMPYLWCDPYYDKEVGRWLFWQRYTGDAIHIKCPYGHVGDRLIIIEPWATENRYNHLKPSEVPQSAMIWYLADQQYNPFIMGKVRSSMFMCNWMSRARPEIKGLRPERLQEITLEDIKAEGISPHYDCDEITYRVLFQQLWDSLNAKRGYPWEKNHWVWGISLGMILH